MLPICLCSMQNYYKCLLVFSTVAFKLNYSRYNSYSGYSYFRYTHYRYSYLFNMRETITNAWFVFFLIMINLLCLYLWLLLAKYFCNKKLVDALNFEFFRRLNRVYEKKGACSLV